MIGKKKLLKSIVLTLATVAVGLSSLAGEHLRHGRRQQAVPPPDAGNGPAGSSRSSAAGKAE